MNLKETQELFKRLILDPQASVPEQFIAPGNGRLNLNERLTIYRTDYRERFVETLGESFPNTFAILGLENFRRLILKYIEIHPSRHYDLGIAGKSLADFVREDALNTEYPFLSDLIQTEWEIIAAFQGQHEKPLGASILLHYKDADWEEARFSFQPTLKVMQSGWALPALLKMKHQEAVDLGSLHQLEVPSSLAIYQDLGGQEPGGASMWEALQLAEGKALAHLQKGATLGQVCQEVLSEDEVGQFQTWFSRWLERGWVTGLEFSAN